MRRATARRRPVFAWTRSVKASSLPSRRRASSAASSEGGATVSIVGMFCRLDAGRPPVYSSALVRLRLRGGLFGGGLRQPAALDLEARLPVEAQEALAAAGVRAVAAGRAAAAGAAVPDALALVDAPARHPLVPLAALLVFGAGDGGGREDAREGGD